MKEYRYEAQLKLLASQDVTLTNIRNRSLTVLTASSILVSVSTAVGLISADPNKVSLIPRWASVPLLFTLVGIAVLVMLIQRSVDWHSGPDEKKFDIAAIDIEAEFRSEKREAEARGNTYAMTLPERTVEAALGEAIALLIVEAEQNEETLEKHSGKLQACIALFMLQLTFLCLAIAWPYFGNVAVILRFLR
ncbi:hypothetical protein [Streptomyces platensis]|uniref:hypothetical protein n=1 Tax=Streptomyces platensis TaxID=58346 RepID=UPI00332CB5F0